MTREQKIKYLQFVRDGIIEPVKPLPAGIYEADEKSGFTWLIIGRHVFKIYGQYKCGKNIATASAIFLHDYTFDNNKVNLIPDDMQEQFQRVKWQSDWFTGHLINSFTITETTAAAIAERQLQKAEQEAEEQDKIPGWEKLGVFTDEQFQPILRKALELKLNEDKFFEKTGQFGNDHLDWKKAIEFLNNKKQKNDKRTISRDNRRSN